MFQGLYPTLYAKFFLAFCMFPFLVQRELLSLHNNLLVDVDQCIFAAAKADLRGVFQRMQAVAGLDALDQRGAILRRVHKVDTRLIQRHRVGGGEDADVVHIRLGGAAVAVAVHRKAGSSR